MRSLNAFRQALADAPDVTPVVARLATNDTAFEIPAGDLRRVLGEPEYEGAWCYPVGGPGGTAYPPLSERQPDKRWTRPNWRGAAYLLGGKTAIHTGDDLDLEGAADIGEPVRAPCAGQVTYAQYVPNSTWGNVLVLRLVWGEGPDEWAYARFAHLNAFGVKVGDAVQAGQIVAWAGNVGMPQSPHLHWGVGLPGDDLLSRQPLNWPSTALDEAAARAFILAHYADPGAFVRDKLLPPLPKPAPGGLWYVTRSNLNCRREPVIRPDNVLVVLPLGARVRLAEGGQVDGERVWRQVTDSPYAAAIGGWLAQDHVQLAEEAPWMRVRGTTSLNVRAAPSGGLAGAVLGKLPLGAGVRLAGNVVAPATPGGPAYNWGQIVEVGEQAPVELVGGWVARELLDALNPKPPAAANFRRAGVHTIGALSNNAIQLLKDCQAAGAPVSSITLVVCPQAARLVKFLSPGTLTIARPVWPDSLPMESGRVKFSREWFESYLDPIRPWLEYIDVVKFVNEKWPGNKCADRQILADFRDFYWDLGRACADRGIGYTVLDLAAGNMADDRHAPKEINQFEIMAPMLDWISRHGGILNYHCYNPLDPARVYDPTFEPENWVLRPVHWLQRIPTLRCVGVESLVPEWKDLSGQDARLPSDSGEVIRMVRQVDELWAGAIRSGRIRDEQWIGHDPFTDVAGERWKNYNMEPHQPALAQYLIRGA